MANSKIIDVNGIGPVLFEKSKRAGRVVISIRGAGSVRVAVPVRISYNEAIELFSRNKDWVLKKRTAIEKNKERNKSLQEAFSGIDRAGAKEWLKARLSLLAEKHRFSYNRLSIRNQKTRWGSCSSQNNISLNIKLVILPSELIDYVLLHELVHTRIHNHSPKFYKELDKYTGDARKMAKRLREYNLRLI